jgi:GNAT superfamily N-acetyltransferase
MRLLTEADVPSACQLSTAAGWNQTEADWARMVALEPLGCFCIEQEERVVATATLLTYGRDLAWVGMVLTHSEYQRRGYARLLVTAALELAGARGVRSVKLDATDQGRALYADLGFIDEQPIERWQGRPRSSAQAGVETAPSALFTLDFAAFAADRSRFLNTLESPFVTAGAYAMSRPGAQAHYLGPCVARDPASAARVIQATLTTHAEEPWFWDILPANESALELAKQLGFAPIRRLTRMVRGEPVHGDESMVYAIAGFEAG